MMPHHIGKLSDRERALSLLSKELEEQLHHELAILKEIMPCQIGELGDRTSALSLLSKELEEQ
jgi:hypothetical protein